MRKSFRTLFLLHVFVLICVQLPALTLCEALAIAESHSLLKIADSEINIAEIEEKFSSLRGPAELSLTTEKLGGPSGFGASEISLEYAVPLKNLGLSRSAANLARMAKETEKIKKSNLRKFILNETAKSFNRALIMEEFVEKAAENIENSKKLLEVSQIMAESGSISESEVYRAELVVKQAEQDYSAAEGDLEQALSELSVAMGTTQNVKGPLKGQAGSDLELPDINSLNELILKHNSEIVALNSELIKISGRRALIRASERPSWKIVGGAVNERESGDTTAVFGISGEFPHRRDNKKEIEILKEEEKRLTLLLNNVKREAFLKLEGLVKQFERLKMQTAGLKADILPGAERLYNLSVEGYKLGKIGQTEVLQVQRELLDMRKAYLEKTKELWAAATDIETLTGHGFTYLYECGPEGK